MDQRHFRSRVILDGALK